MQNRSRIIFFVIAIFLLAWLGFLLFKNFSGAGPALKPPPYDISENTTGLPLTTPPGFSIHIFAKNLKGVRDMEYDNAGNVLVSIPSEGKVVALTPDADQDGFSDKTITVIDGLNRPHGLAFSCRKECRLYIAESHQVNAYTYDQNALRATFEEKIADLPDGGNHYTRSIMFLPASPETASQGGPQDESNRLLISVGSTCNVCNESDDRRASIQVVDTDADDPASTLKTFARGLRNSVFMSLHPVNGKVWATEMGRDLLGDDIPPDEINIIEEGNDYGWPRCYGKNILDTNFVKAVANIYCVATTPSHIDLEAHSAPLGVAFIPEDPPRLAEASRGEAGGWPEDWWYDAIVAYHGSWNRSVPTGYKIVRFPLDAEGNATGKPIDFVSGWLVSSDVEGLTPDGALGRPVDIVIHPGGTMFVSDDKAGVIYHITLDTPA